ncbi:hypothetical protein EDB81DRAFT_34278 [Dactylonectria macrodidyma]|uniref:PD-(D/E)XK nuclease-like domain-containing protein n=1 Tax=Dactylonectria macrodidyma TaxID=307937 RepID=A0A9P9JJ48_9HYPO|nr:hypothetical protein EDB81DRAFT_34278 [Dactylonectria macrodidyma]
MAGEDFPEACYYKCEDYSAALAAQLIKLDFIAKVTAYLQPCKRIEEFWKDLLHSPLLKDAFGSDVKDIEGTLFKCEQALGEPVEVKDISARFEPIMSATILYDWVPRLQLRAHDSTSDTSAPKSGPLACSVTSDQSQVSFSGSSDTRCEINVPTELRHTKTNTNIVDYAVALQLAKDDTLHGVLQDLTNEECARAKSRGVSISPYVNQTAYTAVRDSLIAASIEVNWDGTPLGDPSEQLGIWIAAFHNRMKALRLLRLSLLDRDNATPSQHEDEDLATGPLLVSLHLIVITGAQWDVFYAADYGTSIEVFGPFALGRTDTVLDVFTLLASLKAVGKWVEGTFYKSMREWFMCTEDE